jgi:hypothetical protein
MTFPSEVSRPFQDGGARQKVASTQRLVQAENANYTDLN